MNIGIITDSIDDNAGGIQTYTRNLVNNLLNDVRLPKHNYYLVHHKQMNDSLYSKQKQIIIPIPNMPFGREVRKFLMPFYLRRDKLDILHETAQIGPFFVPSKFKKIVTIHDLAPLVLPNVNTFLVWLHHKLIMGWCLQKSDMIIADSINTKDDIIKFFGVNPLKIRVVYGGYSKIFRPIKEKKRLEEVKTKYYLPDKFILAMGTLEPRKNYVRLFEAYARLNTSVGLVILGRRGWKYRNIFDTVKRLKLDKKVLIIENVKPLDIPEILNISEFLIYPSLYEGFGLPPLEAMACGKAVIASNVSSIPEVVGDSAVMIDPYNINEIASAMRKLLNNPKLVKDLEKKGINHAKKYSWVKYAKEIKYLYQSFDRTGAPHF